MMNKNLERQKKIDQIFSSQAPAIDRLAEGYHYILGQHVEESGREIELLKALGDREQVVKEQIKHSLLQHVLSVFDDCYFRATGELWQPKPKDEPEVRDE